MEEINKQAESLNQAIKDTNKAIFDLLSERGKAIFFPHTGILGQTAEAEGTKLNATIGMAYEDDGSIMALSAITKDIALSKDDVFPYAPSFGNKDLRKEWQKQIVNKNPPLSDKISLPVVTNALTHGLNIVGYLFADSDTRVVLAEPYWGNYKLTFGNTYGAKLIPFSLFRNSRFNVEGLVEALNRNNTKKILVLNFPNNPTGYTPTEKKVDDIVKVISDYAEKKALVVICDDAYFGLVYEEGIYQESIFSKLYNLHKNILAVKIDGITKEYFAWGLRIGFVTYGCKNGKKNLYQALEEKTAGAVRATISNVSSLSQALSLKSLRNKDCQKEKTEKRKLLQGRYRMVKKILSNNSQYKKYFRPMPFNSGYFMCIELNNNLNAEQIRKYLLEKYSTGLIAIDNMLRIAFSSLAERNLEELFRNIFKTCQKMDKELWPK